MDKNTQESVTGSTLSEESKVVLDWAMSFEDWKHGCQPDSTTYSEVQAWELARTNKSEGFRSKTGRYNSELPVNVKGQLGTTLTFPQWLRKDRISRGVYNLKGVWARLNTWREKQEAAKASAPVTTA